MEYIKDNITFVVTTLTLLSNIAFVLGLVFLVVNKQFKDFVYKFVEKNILILLFVISLSAMIGSLLYSNIIGFPPCELCWFQRIFLYPQVLLSLIAFIKKDLNIVMYLLPLSILGAAVSFFHSLVQMGIGSSILGGCVAVGGECAKVYVKAYNYITIPFMSFTIFAYLIAITIIYYKAKKQNV